MVIPIKNAKIGKKIQIDVQYKITAMLPNKKKRKTKKLENTFSKFASIAFRSFESLFRILPNGTLSKNSFNGENSKLLIMDSWIINDILGVENARIKALKNAKTP